MNPEAYAQMASTESTHWWFCARRLILEQQIQLLDLPPAARILEVGSGTGGNLAMLSRYGSVSAMEMNAGARDVAARNIKTTCTIRSGCCPHDIPYSDETFDLICMFDVLEHIQEDVETLNVLRGHLTKGGRMLITVPAYQWLWGAHDVFLHHKRRYTARRLKTVLAASGMQAERITYFNTLLLPLAALARLKDRVTRNEKAAGTGVPQNLINASMRAVFASERHLLRHFNLPAGVSLLGVARAA